IYLGAYLIAPFDLCFVKPERHVFFFQDSRKWTDEEFFILGRVGKKYIFHSLICALTICILIWTIGKRLLIPSRISPRGACNHRRSTCTCPAIPLLSMRFISA